MKQGNGVYVISFGIFLPTATADELKPKHEEAK